MPHADSNNVIQENSYGSPVNGNSLINGKNEHVIFKGPNLLIFVNLSTLVSIYH